jgi:hypothetical protein
MHAAVLKEINSTCECFSKEVILEKFETYFEVLEREVFDDFAGLAIRFNTSGWLC